MKNLTRNSIVGILLLILLNACSPDLVQKTVTSPMPKATYTPTFTPTETTTPTITETPIPTETVTPTEMPRFVDLIPPTKELCRTQNVIRFDHREEDMSTLLQMENEYLSTQNITNRVVLYISFADNGLAYNELEFRSKAISCSFLEIDKNHTGLFVIGNPYLSYWDEKVHIFHAAFDWDNLDTILSKAYPGSVIDTNTQKYIDYSFLTSMKYRKIRAHCIGKFNRVLEYTTETQLKYVPSYFENVAKVYSVESSAYAEFVNTRHSAIESLYPDIIEKMDKTVTACDYVAFSNR